MAKVTGYHNGYTDGVFVQQQKTLFRRDGEDADAVIIAEIADGSNISVDHPIYVNLYNNDKKMVVRWMSVEEAEAMAGMLMDAACRIRDRKGAEL